MTSTTYTSSPHGSGAAKSVIVHKIEKASGASKPLIHPRKILLPLTPQVLKLIASVAELYTNASSKKHGVFEGALPGLKKFSDSLAEHEQKKIDFLQLTTDAIHQLAKQMEGESFATGAYVLFFDWYVASSDFLYVAMLTDKFGSAIDESNLDVLDSVHLDLDRLRVAGRINLSEWRKTSGKQYLSILTGRGLGDASRYFRRFIGIDEKVDEKIETGKLIDYFKEYVRENKLPPEEAHAVSLRLNDHLRKLAKEQRPLFIDEIGKVINPEEDTAFSSFLKEKGYELSSDIIPHKDTLRRLVRVAGRNEHMSLSFEAALIGQGVSLSDDGTELIVSASLVPDEVIAAVSNTQSGNGNN